MVSIKISYWEIVKNYLQLNDAAAVVEAQIFPDAEAENCIATGIARRVSQNDDIYGERYVECAEIAAVGRALQKRDLGLNCATSIPITRIYPIWRMRRSPRRNLLHQRTTTLQTDRKQKLCRVTNNCERGGLCRNSFRESRGQNTGAACKRSA